MDSYIRVVAAVCLLASVQFSSAQSALAHESPIPRIVNKDGRFALLVDGAPFLILGAQVNNSSAWPAILPRVWPAIEDIQANTVEFPIYWEQFEPTEGHFDYTVVDTILQQARAHNVRLVLLWFGTWKNGSSHYMPMWLKTDSKRAPLVVGENGKPIDSPSPFAPSALKADIAAFTALMRHLKAADPQRTVLMVQVENEPGVWGGVRDYSPEAQKVIESPVPPEVLKAMNKEISGSTPWKSAFGDDADEFFQAWAVAHYIQQVAAAGKAVYSLPLYVNVALRDPFNPGRPPSYESGGATENVIPIWKATAPAIDLLAPDIYMDGAKYLKVLDFYHRPDNALFIPESVNRPETSRFFFSALGHQALGFAPFGIDYTRYVNHPLGASRVDKETLAPFALNYELAGPIAREIARLNFEGKLQGVAEEKGRTTQDLDFGNWQAIVSYGLPAFGPAGNPPGNTEPAGRAFVAQLGPDEFLMSGFFCRVDFRPADATRHRVFLRVEEGTYKKGVFQPIRIWNGDQTDWGLNFSSVPQVLRVMLSTF